MSVPAGKNYHVVLKSRPGANSEPTEENFGYEECDSPPDVLADGDILIKNCYLSTDPAQRCQMNDSTGVHYIDPWPIGGTILGLNGVGVVVKSSHPDYSEGDLIHGSLAWPWKQFFVQHIAPADTRFTKVDKNIVGEKPSLVLSLLGMVGLTAILGMREKGHVTRGANQTCVVSGAAGACGSLAGQIAQIDGCTNVVGICGTDEKCKWLTEDVGFTSSINYKTSNVGEALRTACPRGVDVYFDNVGGSLSDTVIQQMNKNSHIVLCGQIAVYNKDVPYPPPIPEHVQKVLEERNITRERYLVLNYQEKFEESLKELAQLYFTGKIKVRETVSEGLANAGSAFVSMMKGGNIGKQIVHVADP